jgi:hypothetical protein
VRLTVAVVGRKSRAEGEDQRKVGELRERGKPSWVRRWKPRQAAARGVERERREVSIATDRLAGLCRLGVLKGALVAVGGAFFAVERGEVLVVGGAAITAG